MNKEEILAMKPGRESDMLVGRHIEKLDNIMYCPHYSTVISAAWPVMERMVGDGFIFGLKCDSSGCSVKFGEFGDWIWGNAPEAICKAALLAKLGLDARRTS